MKSFVLLVFCALQILNITSKVIPERLPQPCSKSVPNYSECTYKVLKKMGPHILKGVRELNFPKMNPLNVPLFIVNRTVNELVSISAVMRNMQLWGYNTTQFKNFKFDTENMNGELHLTVPNAHVLFEFEVSGRLLSFNLDEAGYFKGNFTNFDIYITFGLRQIDKLGVKYYSFEKFNLKAPISDGHIKVISKHPDGQAAADLLTNFYNDNPKRVMDAIQPIFDESLGEFYKSIVESVLNTVPAEELIPE